MSDYTLTEAVRNAITKALSGIHTCLPGRIESYDYTKRLSSVKPLIKKKYKDGTLLSLPIIENVPVVWLAGGGASFTFPLERGDGVLLVFSERSMDNWLSIGGDAEPGSETMFDLSDAIAIPGLYPFNVSSSATSNSKVELIYDNASITIDRNGQININDGNLTVDL